MQMGKKATIAINIDKRVFVALHVLLYFFAGCILLMIASEHYFDYEQSLINSWNFSMTIFGEKIRVYTGRIIYEFIYFLWTYFFFKKIFMGKKTHKSVKFFPLILGIIVFAMLTSGTVLAMPVLSSNIDIFSVIYGAVLRSIHALINGIIVMGIAVYLDNKQMKGL